MPIVDLMDISDSTSLHEMMDLRFFKYTLKGVSCVYDLIGQQVKYVVYIFFFMKRIQQNVYVYLNMLKTTYTRQSPCKNPNNRLNV